MSELFPIWLYFSFFIVALLYSLVGFGGGSSYLALMALAGLSYFDIPPIALICNIVVTSTSLYHFSKNGFFNLKQILPFVILSIPMAYIGGTIAIDERLFNILLGVSLLIASIRIFIRFETNNNIHYPSLNKSLIFGLPIGGIIGFLSGLIGIGGGIFLSPILLLLRWVNVKEASACASFFIVVNSFSGLFAHLRKSTFNWENIIYLTIIVFLGGQIGGRLGSGILSKKALQLILSGFLFYASFRLVLVGL